jgi:glycosyltransferase involved in cell wall biosynthesis
MVVGIDASRAFIKNRTGIEEYSYQVIKHLVEPRHCLGSTKVVLYIRKNQKIDFSLPKNWETRVIKFPYLWTQIGLSLELLFNPVDILFVPAHVVPCIHPARNALATLSRSGAGGTKNTIVTIHGLEYEFCPEAYSFWERLYMRASIKMSCRWAKKIIAVSKNTKKDLMELYKVPENKIEVIYEGVNDLSSSPLGRGCPEGTGEGKNLIKDENPKFSPSSGPPRRTTFSLREKGIFSKPYLLFIGRLEKRKNIEGIISAFEILKEKYKIPHKLFLAGRFGYGEDDIKDKINGSKYKKEIVVPGFVRDEDKGELIKNADVFLFPTFYEGFGLPILEAQSLGVPVVTSNISSLSEVGGESVFYADPQEPEIIADAVFELIGDQKLKDDIIRKGHENVKRFSWGKCADQIVKLLNC